MGCQMNEADSQHLASELEKLGFVAATDPDAADVYVVNTCVVRQSAEDKAYGRLYRLRTLKESAPDKVIGLMGCLVGVKDPLRLRKQLPFVDVFMAPSTTEPMTTFLAEKGLYDPAALAHESAERAYRDALQDEDEGAIRLPLADRGNLISAFVPVVYGCSHACSFCIIPYRRGVERSRPVGEIVAEVRSMARQGVKEITFLGQIVDRYGKDIPDGPDLADLLRVVHDAGRAEGIERFRFLTSHPNWMTDKLLDTVAEMPGVMPQIEVPAQAGNDEVLARMKRGYTQADYRKLIARIRDRVPNVAIHTDIIVGFCGETDEQFEDTYNLLAELKLDKVHLAKYSARPTTLSQRTMVDDVPEEEKERRRVRIDELQAGISAGINSQWLGQQVEVLVEEKQGDKWRGRTPQNKIVFFEDETQNRKGQVVNVEVTWTGPWSMQARLPGTAPVSISEDIITIIG
jgi:tRNA-2-methylthio-N6-dimethylallyladenosine synthase